MAGAVVSAPPPLGGACGGCGGGAPPSPTTIVPCMNECTEQWYLTVSLAVSAGDVKVSPTACVCAGLAASESKLCGWPESVVTEWFVSGPSQCQVTVSPMSAWIGVGENEKLAMWP